MKAEAPAGQIDRLKDLYDLHVLDTDPEDKFEDVVKLASQICGMPISLVSLVSDDRQWFKASVGMEAPETPIEQAICAHAILEDDFLEITDTRVDSRTHDNPLVTGPDNLRFYAGAVLRTSRGNPIGTLCVLDTKPNELTELQRETLRVLARQVMAQLELRRALREAEVLRREVDHRVKNSLQSVSAMTRMQARSVKSEEAREALDLTRRRIETVALLHQQLYSAQDGNHVAVDDFLPRVAQLLQNSVPDRISIDCKVDQVTLTAAHAAALGVIVNEFTANSVKHGFGEDQSGTISFDLHREAPDLAILTCQDTGTGLSDTKPATPGMGLRIIDASAHQLGGSSQIESTGEGLRVTIRIPLDPAADATISDQRVASRANG
ncbi:histidine kinase dimerization/phosphoacceptor domain -containing protein [Pseudooceanicola sp. MF1-13]|uniref:histidine kinase dimerization/phosphoacceptor domain -containing protein n=1 Tax=Pseudooceanicola sp. MF1-13 TaxID=3379095 RepID=UPI003892B3CF